jgi:anti-sigma factor RsiW
MDNDTLHDLTAAYALDALDADDARAYEHHLAGCERCRDELASLSAAAGSLAYAVLPAEPPPALRQRILQAAVAERPNVVPLQAYGLHGRHYRLIAAVAAVAACAVVGLGVWNVVLHDDLNNAKEALRGVPLTGASGSVVVGAGGSGALVVSNLSPAPAGKTYEAWVIKNGKALPAGTFSGGGRTIVIRLTRALPAGAIVAVTLERGGGVEQPTREPFITSQPV